MLKILFLLETAGIQFKNWQGNTNIFTVFNLTFFASLGIGIELLWKKNNNKYYWKIELKSFLKNYCNCSETTTTKSIYSNFCMNLILYKGIVNLSLNLSKRLRLDCFVYYCIESCSRRMNDDENVRNHHSK